MKLEIRSKILLAGLLKGVGIFYKRADLVTNNKFDLLQEKYLANKHLYCKGNLGDENEENSDLYILWTVQFIQENKEIFKKVGINVDENSNSLIELISNTGENFQKLIQNACFFATGSSNDKFSLDKSLIPIFCLIDEKSENAKFRTPITTNKLDESFFPNEHFSQKEEDYRSLWKDFTNEFKQLPTNSFNVFLTSLIYLLEKYWVSIPSNQQDVSLYDFAKVTGGFSVSMFDFYNEQLENDIALSVSRDDESVLLVGADVSGIQKFIYDIISKNAAKNMKGRSFYLQLTVDAILRHFIRELNLSFANVIYSSGGSFFLVVGNTNSNKQKLKEIEKYISNQLFEYHGTNLFLAFESNPISKNNIIDNEISSIWQNLIEKLNSKKRQKFSTQLIEQYDIFFGDKSVESGGKQKRDSITGEELFGKVIKLADGSNISEQTYKQISLGKDLYRAKYMLVSNEKIKGTSIDYQPLGLQFHYQFEKKITSISEIHSETELITFNDTDFLKGSNNISYGFIYYGGNSYPVNAKNEPKSFDKMATSGEFKRLGILRMDVDNLGKIFKSGFASHKKSFSRYASLSRNLDYFFKGYINKIQEKYNDVLILYSGGDDLFILGNWIEVIDISENIQKSFKAWTCNNPRLTLSGGMVLITNKYPILKAAELAGLEEHNAKSYRNGDLQKNAFSLFGTALSWEDDLEFRIVKELKTKLLSHLKDEVLPKSFYGLISVFSDKRKEQIEHGKNESWRWQLTYMLSRFAKRNRKNSELSHFLNQVKTDIFANSYLGKRNNAKHHYLDLLNLAVRWADFEYRSK